MNLSSQTEPLFLRVTKKPVTKKNKFIFFAVEVDPERWFKLDNKTHYIVEICDSDVDAYGDELDKGAVCRIIPETLLQKNVMINDSSYNRRFITASCFTIVRSKGSLIINLLGSSNKFKGIGTLKAGRLWERFDEKLYEILDNKQVCELTADFKGRLTTDTAKNLVEAWESYVYTDSLLYCDKLNLTVSQAFRITRYYKDDTKRKIEEDPYRLLAFNISFEMCDEIATKQYRIPLDDNRRLSAAVEEALYRVLDSGSVVSDDETLREQIISFISKDDTGDKIENKYVTLALQGGHESNNYVLLENGNYQSNGSFLMEMFIANRVKFLLGCQLQLEIADFRINEIILEYESRNGFDLTDKQKVAVASVVNNKLCIINGGAGVGKTTVLDCIYSVFYECGITPVQVALAAKAAKRMSEATGRDSYTIARFIRRFKREGVDFTKFALVLDESSMVDLFSMYKLLSFLPEESRIIILGDNGQLHPVGYGLILHELLKVPNIPNITLTEVKRQGKDSNIPHVSQEIRSGIVPTFDYQDVEFIKASTRKSVLKSVLSIYQADTDNTQVICATRKMADSINAECSSLNKSKKLLAFNEYYDAFEDTGFRLSDKVMCTANLYAIDVMNASIGEIIECYKETKEVEIKVNDKQEVISSFGKVKWDDGLVTEITDELLDNLTHAYAMTIHKSQGSQFHTVVIPVFQTAYMDRTMLYTAVTRAQKKVVLIGSEKLLVQSIDKVHSDGRKADLANKLIEILNNNKILN